MDPLAPYNSELNLMQDFTRGEKAAFTSVYEAYYLPVYQFASRFLPSGEDARDITAETFVKLWQHRETFDNLGHIRGFLYTTARNACLNFLDHARVKVEKHAEIFRSLKAMQDEEFYLEEVRAELMKLVYDEVEKLPAKMKEIFLLSYKEGLRPLEIAERLKISVQTVSNQKYTAIQLLNSALGNSPLLLALLFCLEAGSSNSTWWTA